ncbi:polysaccharide lyase family 3 protein [Gonapodya prolifera JEL478]|uniref:Pectate lyase n=1 Tax=Gonapodya prolifera (strain JEL478) TaxID=1344416 RepID=A0A139AWJ7_GONPJ|nr:polysaccharide lyase family 3 protein [Gonapodya prolifera JEL478]|eukprot:KXS20953.1 polysaccharide lyase family 3 protein [Gonapodya prolifera JEL478]
MIIKTTLGLLLLALTASSAPARANFKHDESDFNIEKSHRILTARDLVGDLTIDGDVELAARALGNDFELARRAASPIPAACKSSSTKPPSGLPSKFPTATGSRSCSAPITVSGTFDGGMYRYDRGAGFRDSNNCLSIEPGSADTIFLLNDGATLQNVIIGREVLDSVYCLGSCTLTNVWFEETCEDSLSFKNPTSCSSCVMSWTGGAVNGFHDKAVQHNGGGTAKLSNIDVYYTTKSKGKFYRSCGGCSYPDRHVEVTNVRAHGVPGEAFVGINTSKAKDSAKFKSISIPSSFGTSWPVCKKFGTSETSGPDGTFCIYSSSDITYTSS